MTVEHYTSCFSPRSSSLVLFAVESSMHKLVDSESSPLCLQDSHLELVTKTAGTKGRRRRRQRVLEMLFCPLWCWRTKITLPVTLVAFIVTLWKEEDNDLIFFLATRVLIPMKIHKRIGALRKMKCFPCQFSNTIKSAQFNTSALMSVSFFDQGMGIQYS